MREYWNLLKNGQLNKEQLSSLLQYPKDFSPIKNDLEMVEVFLSIVYKLGENIWHFLKPFLRIM